MAQPSLKKRKTKGDEARSDEESVVTDPRFTNIQFDPRYRLPGKRRADVRVDKRFSHMLRDEDFIRKATVDRYGRPLEDGAERSRLKKRYEFEDGVDDDQVQKELERVREALDPLRDGGYSQSSSSEPSSSDEDESDETAEVQGRLLGNQQDIEVPLGNVSSRIAVVNLDWDNIRAVDLMAVFSSFLPSGGRLLKISVHPSQFGRECMEREEMEGPPKEIFASSKDGMAKEVVEDEVDDLERIKDTIVQADKGEELDSAALRRYQLQRLQYYYAILTFSSPDAARSVYDAVDGAEYLTTANFFDLRFVPEDVDFVDDKVRDECEALPNGYKPNEFVTNALQHSNVKLTWDADDSSRKTAQAKAFRGSRKDIDENDLKAYLGSDSSSDEEVQVEEDSAVDKNLSRKEQERQKMRALLGLEVQPKKRSKPNDGPVGDLQITFSSGLLGESGTKESIFPEESQAEETTVEKYKRRERERKNARKEKMKPAREGTSGDLSGGDESPGDETRDLGFDDPFFAALDQNKGAAAKIRKEDRLKKRAERQAEEAAAAAERAELELLMVDDKDGDREVRHFDMKEIEKREKLSKKKGKLSKKRRAQQRARETQNNDDFKVDTHDPRFSRLFENHDFAIDPTNPRFKGTEGMKALLEEARSHRKKKNQEDPESKEVVQKARPASRPREEDVEKLLHKLKSREKA